MCAYNKMRAQPTFIALHYIVCQHNIYCICLLYQRIETGITANSTNEALISLASRLRDFKLQYSYHRDKFASLMHIKTLIEFEVILNWDIFIIHSESISNTMNRHP